MGSFNQGGNRRSFGGDRDRGGRRERPEMHRAICAECGKECEVPFKSTNDKPVYCSSCFERQSSGDRSGRRSSDRGFGRGSDRRDRGSDRRSDSPRFGDKQMYRVVCDKCHKECEVPFKPTSDKPVYCSDCFGKNETFKSQKNGEDNFNKNEDQFKVLNTKLDRIIKLLLPNEEKLVEKKIIDLKKTIEAEKDKVVKKIKEIKKVVAIAPKKVIAKKPVKKIVIKKKK